MVLTLQTFKKPVRKPTRQMSMSRAEPPAPGPTFRVAIVGAGGINFGTDEGPWNHSFRLEKYAVSDRDMLFVLTSL